MMTFETFVGSLLALLSGRFASVERTTNVNAFEIDFTGRTRRIEGNNPSGFLLTLIDGDVKRPARSIRVKGVGGFTTEMGLRGPTWVE